MLCVPARFLHGGAAIVSVFNWEIKDEKKRCLFAFVERITEENEFHKNVVSDERVAKQRVSDERGLKWAWSQMNVVSNERGVKWTSLTWMWSQMNGS